MNEAAITINGRALSEAQAMTVRVALNAFISDLRDNGLGEDEHGQAMTAAYTARSCEILQMIASSLTPDLAQDRQ